MKKTIILAAALVAMTACNKSIIETSNPADGYGFIELGITADTEMVVTKTGSVMSSDALASYMWRILPKQKLLQLRLKEL